MEDPVVEKLSYEIVHLFLPPIIQGRDRDDAAAQVAALIKGGVDARDYGSEILELKETNLRLQSELLDLKFPTPPDDTPPGFEPKPEPEEESG